MLEKVAVATAAFLLALSGAAAADEAQIARGEYLARIMDCTGCHTPGSLLGNPDMSRYLGGSDIGFLVPGLGIAYPPNLTPDAATGIGEWSEADIIKAVRTGVRPDGRTLIPVMPWMSYGALTDDDAAALAAYLKSLPAVSHQAPPLTGPSETPPAPYMTLATP